MNANRLYRPAGILFIAAAGLALPAIAGSGHETAPPRIVALVTPQPTVVVDSEAVAPLDLMLFVHRPDLPLRALPTKLKEHS
ncbi:MAG TPA: hypothetical protein GX403_06585 [Rhodocyclaceae bacterium]|nr:hypothetical protein [Rhodocyclaceae bacterium]